MSQSYLATSMRRSARNADVDGAVLMVAPAARADRAAETRECCRRPASPLARPRQQPPCAPLPSPPCPRRCRSAPAWANPPARRRHRLLGLVLGARRLPRFFAEGNSSAAASPSMTLALWASVNMRMSAARVSWGSIWYCSRKDATNNIASAANSSGVPGALRDRPMAMSGGRSSCCFGPFLPKNIPLVYS